jgi:hypothetical protein
VGALKGGHIGPSSIARGRRGSKHLHARQPEDPTARRRACQDGRDRYAARRDVRVGAHQRSGLSGTSLSPAPCGHVRQRSGGRLTARSRCYEPPETVGGRLGDKPFMGGPLMVPRCRAARISVPLARTAAGARRGASVVRREPSRGDPPWVDATTTRSTAWSRQVGATGRPLVTLGSAAHGQAGDGDNRLDEPGDGAHPARRPDMIGPADERAEHRRKASDTTDSADVSVDGLAVTSAVCRDVRGGRAGC